jgi:hypothetical protein
LLIDLGNELLNFGRLVLILHAERLA